MKINNITKNMHLNFTNGYTASVSKKTASDALSWIAYWVTDNGETISVNEWVNDDQVAEFVQCIKQLEPAHLTKGVQNIIAQSIVNKFGG